MSESGEKTEEPTDKKIQDSRKKGQVWNSRDLSGVAGFLVGMGVLKAFWPTIQANVTELFQFTFDKVAHPKELEAATFQMLVLGLWKILLLSLPVALAASLMGAMATFLQVGPLMSMDTLMPKLEKLNPIQGMKNMFSKKQLVELIKSMLKLSIAAYVVFAAVRDAMGMVVATSHADASTALSVLGELVYRVSVRVGLLFMVFAIFDVWWQRKSYFKDLMMTKDEVKREYKESEGDPHHKAKRKELHQEILESAQMEAVRKADVVVTNPTHFAVAIQYDKAADTAPKVVAKGAQTRAQAIRELATEAQVPIVRNVPLAQALHRLEVGQEIPEELYDAVAEVLNFVYSLQPKAA